MEEILFAFGIVVSISGLAAMAGGGEVRKRQLARAGKAAWQGIVIATTVTSLAFMMIVSSGAPKGVEFGVFIFLGGGVALFVVALPLMLLGLGGGVWLFSALPSVILSERNPMFFSSRWKRGVLAGGLGMLWGGAIPLFVGGIMIFVATATATEAKAARVGDEAIFFVVNLVAQYCILATVSSAAAGCLLGGDRVLDAQDQSAKPVRNRFLKTVRLILFILFGSIWGIFVSVMVVAVIYVVVSALMEPSSAGRATEPSSASTIVYLLSVFGGAFFGALVGFFWHREREAKAAVRN